VSNRLEEAYGKTVSRRTETAYKAESAGKLAQHNKARGSADTVNAAIVQGKFTSLSGEICFTCDDAVMAGIPEGQLV